MTDKVIWVKKLDHPDLADCLAYAIIDAIKAHPSAIMDVQVRVDAYETVVAVAVIADADEPDETAFWAVILLGGTAPSIGDEL